MAKGVRRSSKKSPGKVETDKDFVFIGVDASLDHGAIVAVNINGEVIHHSYYTTEAKFRKDTECCLCHYFKPWSFFKNKKRYRQSQKEVYNAYRLNQIVDYLFCFHMLGTGKKWITPWLDLYVNIEDYAVGAQSASVYQIGEAGGMIRHFFLRKLKQTRLRLTNPSSLASWIGRGAKSSKRFRIAQAHDEGFKIPKGLTKEVKLKGVLDLDGPGTDLADAFWLAQMLRTEVQLRLGTIILSFIPQHQRDVVNAVTKAHPIGLLTRKFITDADLKFDV